ncbi:MAG: PEP-CTERM sorting domain-containing protein [Bryobacteraceae bacterium]
MTIEQIPTTAGAPEPSTIALIAGPLGALALLRRRNTSK